MLLRRWWRRYGRRSQDDSLWELVPSWRGECSSKTCCFIGLIRWTISAVSMFSSCLLYPTTWRCIHSFKIHLAVHHNELSVAFVFACVKKALWFLNNDCSLIHNNVCTASVFVDRAGEWKLGGVDYMYPAAGPESVPPVKLLPMLEKYDPPERGPGPAKRPATKWLVQNMMFICTSPCKTSSGFYRFDNISV